MEQIESIGKGHDSVTDFQPGIDKIRSCKPTVDHSSQHGTGDGNKK